MRAFDTQTFTGAIAVTDASQMIAPANPRRDLLMLQNTDDSASLYWSIDVPASAGGSPDGRTFVLAPGQYIRLDERHAVPTGAVNVAGTAGATYCLLVGQTGSIT